MRLKQILLTLSTSLIFSLPASADIIPGNFEQSKNLDNAPIIDLELENNGNTLMAVAQYPNGCYSPWKSFQKVRGDEFILVHLAEYPEDTVCTRQLQFHETSYNLRHLDPGTYEIVDATGNTTLGELTKEEDRDVNLELVTD